MRRDRTIALVLLLAALGLFFYPLLLGRTFSTVAGHQSSVYPWRASPTGFTDYPQSDQADLSYPWQVYLTRSIRAGEWPWWNPGSFGGQPIFSNGSSAMFYPPRLLAALLVSPSWAHDLLSVLHLLFGGWFMYLLLREFDAEFPGAVYGALTWMLNSFAFAWLHLEVVAPVITFLPLTVFCVVRAARTHSWSWSAGAAVSLGGSLCAGHLPFMGITFLVSGVYAVWLGITAARHHLAGRDVQTAALEFLRPWVTIALAAGLAAIVLLPTLHTIGESQRQVLPYEAFREHSTVSLGPQVTPPCPVTAGIRSLDASDGVQRHGHRDPGARRRIPSGRRCLVCANRGGDCRAGGAGHRASAPRVLGSAGVQRLPAPRPSALLVEFRGGRARGARLRRNLAMGAEPSTPAPRLGPRLRHIPGVVRPFTRAPGRWRRGRRLALCLFTTIELITYGRAINPPFHPRSPEHLYPVTPLITALSDASTGRAPERVLPIARTSTTAWHPPTLFGAEPLVFGIEAMTGYDSVVPRWALHTLRMLRGDRLNRLIATPFSGAFAPWVYVRATRFDLLARAGVTTVTGSPDITADPYWCPLACEHLQPAYSGPDGRTFRVRDSVPGPWFAYKSRVVQTEADAFRLLADTSFDYRGHVVLHQNDTPEPIRDGLANGSGEIHSVLKSNNRMVVTASSTHAGWLVVPDTFDKGWTATVNGPRRPGCSAGELRISRDPGSGRAAPVEMRYVPEGFVTGAALTGLAVASARAPGSRRPGAAPEAANLAAHAARPIPAEPVSKSPR